MSRSTSGALSGHLGAEGTLDYPALTAASQPTALDPRLAALADEGSLEWAEEQRLQAAIETGAIPLPANLSRVSLL